MERYSAKVDTYLHDCDEEKQRMLNTIRELVHEEIPDIEETITWRMPTFIHPEYGDIVSMAAFKTHIGLYPQPEAIEAFKEELAPYKTSKGAIQFPVGTTLPLLLIRAIVRYRLNLLGSGQPQP